MRISLTSESSFENPDATQATPDPTDREGRRGPIYVDLDGTLIASDMLWETLCGLICHNPLILFALPFWLRQGRARFKHEVARRVTIDPALLPYRPEVLHYLEAEHVRGRRVVLATASNREIAERIAAHLPVIDAVLASDAQRNLRSDEKARAILDDCGGAPFEYLGNSRHDVAIWEKAQTATMVAPTRGARSGLERIEAQAHEIALAPHRRNPVLQAMRPYQWVKNGLLFVPILLAHEVGDIGRTTAVAIAFTCFCLVASATYMLNDLLDIQSDRCHRRKRHRPFASGTLSIPAGIAWLTAFLTAGFGFSLVMLPPIATGMLGLYTFLTVTYSLYIKERLFVDVLLLAGLYTHRVLAGAVAAQVDVSPWLLAFSLFFFLRLALLKRYAELLAAADAENASLSRRAYAVADVGLVENMGLTSGFLSVLVLCLFVSSDNVSKLYPSPQILWLITPIFLYWIGRMWFLARRQILSDDPVLFATRDLVSYLTGGLILIVGSLASWQL